MNLNLFLIIALILIKSESEAKNLKIFACEPEWASLAKELTKDQAIVNVAVTAKQNLHFIQAKPSLIASINKADMVFCSGADLEIGWLPILLEKTSDSKTQPNGDGYLMASDYVIKLEVPSKDRSQPWRYPSLWQSSYSS